MGKILHFLSKSETYIRLSGNAALGRFIRRNECVIARTIKEIIQTVLMNLNFFIFR